MAEHKHGAGGWKWRVRMIFDVVMVAVPIAMLLCEIDKVGEWIEGTMIFYGLRALHVVHLFHGVMHSFGGKLKLLVVWVKKMF